MILCILSLLFSFAQASDGIDVSDHIYTCGGPAVQKYTLSGSLVWEYPYMVNNKSLCLGDNAVFVLDWRTGTGLVTKFDLDGNVLRTFSPVDLFSGPEAIACGNGAVYVADTFNARVLRFRFDGVQNGGWGSFAQGVDSLFVFPVGITAGDGYVYVVDNHPTVGPGLVKKYTQDGLYVDSWPTSGREIDLEGDLLYTIGPEIQVFTPDGTPVCTMPFSGQDISIEGLAYVAGDSVTVAAVSGITGIAEREILETTWGRLKKW